MTWARALQLTLSLCLALPAVPARADDKGGHGFLNRTYKAADGKEAKYVLFVPQGYKGSETYPIILFLHGAGERVGGKKQPVEVGIGPAIKKREKDFRFLVVIPQAEKTWQASSPDAQRALAILGAVMKEYRVDPRRVYLTGLSMGGSGTWSLAAAHPDKWAAIVPICGRADLKTADRIKDLPCWCFVGDKDRPALVENDRAMIAALKAAGGKPKFTEYPGVGHNSWDRAYGTAGLYDWLLQQRGK